MHSHVNFHIIFWPFFRPIFQPTNEVNRKIIIMHSVQKGSSQIETFLTIDKWADVQFAIFRLFALCSLRVLLQTP